MSYSPPKLPLPFEVETKAILKKLSNSHRALAELKGVSGLIPNESILVNTLSLQEAQDSSAVENIITTHDELYRSDFSSKYFPSHAAKEVYSYASALLNGYKKVKDTGLLINNYILEIQETLEENNAGFRKQIGTVLKNEQTGEVVYTPPQTESEIQFLMSNLEQFINNDTLISLDPLVKMAIIHHQFESIHPFYDGNGRTGRIINILYLVKNGLINSPILYLSRYINRNKKDYYRLLQAVRDEQVWEEWILFILDGIEQTSIQTVALIHKMQQLMLSYKTKIKTELPKIYSQDLLNNLFRHPYTKIEFVINDLQISRITATKYLDALVKIGLLSKQKKGKESYYINDQLFKLLGGGSETDFSHV